MRFKLGKQEKLKSRKLISQLFEEGQSVKKYPIKFNFLQTEHTSDFPVQVAFSVPKRVFKRAVDRNRIKRLMREAYRIQKYMLYDNVDRPFVVMITYIGQEEIKYQKLKMKMIEVVSLFLQKLNYKE